MHRTHCPFTGTLTNAPVTLTTGQPPRTLRKILHPRVKTRHLQTNATTHRLTTDTILRVNPPGTTRKHTLRLTSTHTGTLHNTLRAKEHKNTPYEYRVHNCKKQQLVHNATPRAHATHARTP